MNIKLEQDLAARQLQKYIRGLHSRKKTNGYGHSEGKEIEIYIPLAVRKKDSGVISYYDMIGNYKYTLCESDFFNISIDLMNFKTGRNKLKIPEIVTAPFKREGDTHSNLYSESDIDNAVTDFLSILDEMLKKANGEKCCILLNDILVQYNQKNPDHPLRLTTDLQEYMSNPVYVPLFSEESEPVPEHENVELCFYFDPTVSPIFDKKATPRTSDASSIVLNNGYQNGTLLIHVQKTFSLSVNHYNPDFFLRQSNETFHFTEQQLKIVTLARDRAEHFILKHPLPESANKEKILGLLTIATELVLTVTSASTYEDLHEKADRPILSIRQILHYVKLNICNSIEKAWFDTMYLEYRSDIENILSDNKYEGDHRALGGGYGTSMLSGDNRYDALFDLFGIFKNGHSVSQEDINEPEMYALFKKLSRYGIWSWEKLFNNHIALSGRSHFNLQKVINDKGGVEYHPLFEARRIGIMTIDEFKQHQSQVHLVI